MWEENIDFQVEFVGLIQWKMEFEFQERQKDKGADFVEEKQQKDHKDIPNLICQKLNSKKLSVKKNSAPKKLQNLRSLPDLNFDENKIDFNGR